MKLLILVCFILPFSNLVVAADSYCNGVDDFEVCKSPVTLTCNNSECYCKDQTAFCRCHNYKDTWYLGENCDQKWTVTTFALVATLPGVCLAAIVGVIVQLVNNMNKPAKGPKESKSSKGKQPQMAQMASNAYANDDDGSYSNMVFASDMQSRPKPPGMQPPQERIPMATPMSRPYSGQPHGMRPGFERPSLPSNNPSQHYNHGAGLGQPVGNPYARSPVLRDPYEDRAPSPNRYDDRLRPNYPPPGQNMMGGNMSGFPRANLPSQSNSAPHRSPSFQIPHAQMGRPY